MVLFAPEELFRDENNWDKVAEIIEPVPETDVITPDTLRIDAVLPAIRELGEYEVADWLSEHAYDWC